MSTHLKSFLLGLFLLGLSPLAWAQEVIVLGSQEEVMALLDADRWWEKRAAGDTLEVPRRLTLAITERWRSEAANMPVAAKKDVFYSGLLPLVLHANSMVLDRRTRLQAADAKLAAGGTLSSNELEELQRAAVLLRIAGEGEIVESADTAGLRATIKELLYRLDVIPPGLVLGQAAYESGYATSRFAAQGNALFGQWTFGGEGLVPEQQRKQLGDHRIASFDWPFDSVRAYYLNLSSHPAYEEFRQIRARLKANGKPVTSLVLADGLKSYSERGQVYVDTLKGIIRANKLDIADNAIFRDEPLGFVIGTNDQASAAKLRADVEDMRKAGELQAIIDRMRLD